MIWGGCLEIMTFFNQSLGDWDVSNVTDMREMFYQVSSFDQDLGNWSISNVENMEDMFEGVKLSTENYDSLLLSWSNQIPEDYVRFSAGDSQYTPTTMVEVARSILDDTFKWIITDGGPVVLNGE